MNIEGYIKPELMIVIPVLSAAGMALKNIQCIKDRYIPLLLGMLGILICGLWIMSTTVIENCNDVVMALFVSIVQGILCAGMSVYAHQVIKQGRKTE